MRQTIRARIALFSFVVFVCLVVLVGALVFRGLDRALTRLADEELRAELEGLVGEVAEVRLSALLVRGEDPDEDWSDLVFEIRDQLDARAAQQGNALVYELERGGSQLTAQSPALEGSRLPRTGVVTLRDGLSFREEVDPRPGAGSRRLRVAELPLGPYRLQAARRFEPFVRIREAVRAEILLVLVAASLVAGAGSYWIAAGALSPVRRLAEEAERLQTLSEGTLPRSGRRDEVDELVAVLNRLLERVRAEVQRTRQFTADAAHEIRTPLSSVRGHLELLLAEVGPDAQHTISGVLEEVERLTRLVNQLLLLEKLESGPDVARREPLDLARLVRELVDHVGVVADEQGLELSCEGADVVVAGDAERLRQVFLNLLDNAFKHTPRGGRVRVRMLREGAVARVEVLDTGPGIPAEQRERIFDRFSSDRSRPEAGTGLGLPIARAIARAHGGELRAGESAQGARLILELPAA
jgi:signal transduction histidine kinase